MKTRAKHYSSAGDIVLVQFETLKDEGFGFRVAGPAMEAGSLVVEEKGTGGEVANLLAINPTDEYYLLTDMDLLKGAKQNRTVNISVLIAPQSKQEVNVSCVERSRWSWDTPDFSPSPDIVEGKMRAAKAEWLRKDHKEKSGETQGKVWGLINKELMSDKCYSSTEDYNALLENRKKQMPEVPEIDRVEGANGLAVFQGKKLVAVDMFGNREAYQYYYPKMSKGALSQVARDASGALLSVGLIDAHEAFYRLDEWLDDFVAKLDAEDDPAAGGAGTLRWSGLEQYAGFDLSFKDMPVHMAGMGK